MTDANRCADCGRWVERRKRNGCAPGPWGVPLIGSGGLSYACRTVIGEDGRVVSADYHYVKGETQRHFPTVLDTVASK